MTIPESCPPVMAGGVRDEDLVIGYPGYTKSLLYCLLNRCVSHWMVLIWFVVVKQWASLCNPSHQFGDLLSPPRLLVQFGASHKTPRCPVRQVRVKAWPVGPSN